MGAGRCGGTKPWWLSAGLVTRKMELQRGADPTCSICCPQFTGAMYPHFIRQQRTSLDILRNRKHSETPGPGAYDVDRGYQACLPSSPSITIQGVRRPKRHETGPFTTF
ncbi:protein STPG3 isoform X1 [Numida meleagris]|uniref:protein STPG3 isoform X1 n=1 Tax=Numida meleagris TaxID=8996 RepID=UPI000B3D9495|nr:protein STPG3 isoform X1 [Numida meleagris]